MLTKQKLIIFDFLELLLKIRYNNILNNNIISLPSSITFAIISAMFLSPKFIFLFKKSLRSNITYLDLLGPVHIKGKKN